MVKKTKKSELSEESKFIAELKPMINNVSNDGLCFIMEVISKELRTRLLIESTNQFLKERLK